MPAGDMLRELMNDNKAVAAAMRKAHKLCDEHEDVATASLLENFIDATEKRTWFLFEASRARRTAAGTESCGLPALTSARCEAVCFGLPPVGPVS